MGLKLNPAILKDQAQSIIDNLKEDNQSLLYVLDTIEQFTGNTDLKSDAWDNMKVQLSNHEAVIQGLLCANDMVIQNSVTLCDSIGNEKLDEDELKDQIEHLETANNHFSKIKASLESCIKSTASVGSDVSGLYNAIANYNNIIQLNSKKIKDLEEKIQKLYQIETQTNSLYSDAESLYESVESGITAIKKSWDASLGEFDISGIDLSWKSAINQVWKNKEEILQKKYTPDFEDFLFQLFDPLSDFSGNPLTSVLKEYGINRSSICLLRQGVRFNLNKIEDKYWIQLGGSIIDKSMPNKWKNLEAFLRQNIKDIDWNKMDIKKLVNKGWRVDSDFWENIKYKELSDNISSYIDSGSGIEIYNAKRGFSQGLNILDDFKPSQYKGIDFWKRGGKILGAIGTMSNVYENTKENLFDREGNFSPSWDGLQDTITDTGVDILAGATSSAAGAAVGSLFLPPLGTAVGAVAGIAVNELLNFDFIDVNNDGEKDSIVDGTKMLFDSACDAVGDFIDNIF